MAQSTHFACKKALAPATVENAAKPKPFDAPVCLSRMIVVDSIDAEWSLRKNSNSLTLSDWLSALAETHRCLGHLWVDTEKDDMV